MGMGRGEAYNQMLVDWKKKKAMCKIGETKEGSSETPREALMEPIPYWEEEGMNEVWASLDWDGCCCYITEWDSEQMKVYRKWMEVLAKNFENHIRREIWESGEGDDVKVTFACGSARQSSLCNILNMEKNKNGCAFKGIEKIAGSFGKETNIFKGLLYDKYSGGEVGSEWDVGKKGGESRIVLPLMSDKGVKVELIKYQMSQIPNDGGKKKFLFYDDRLESDSSDTL
jgi:hypothetical protein